jgi:3-phenylpropionate/trans-cinnamate dioxygenase ferredoxin component
MSAVLKMPGWSARICAVSELPVAGTALARDVEGRRIAIFNVGGRYYAIDDLCTHAQSSLSGDGRVCGLLVECALHRAEFSLETGRAMRGPTRRPLRAYELSFAAGEVVATEKSKRDSGAGEPL